MQLIAKSLNDLRHVKTNVRLSRDELIAAQYNALCARTEKRQRAAKQDLTRRGIEPRVRISGAYVPPNVSRQYQRCKVS